MKRQVYSAPDVIASSLSLTIGVGPPRRRLVAVNCLITTDATVGTRTFFLQIVSKKGELICSCCAQLTQAASVVGFYCWGAGMRSGITDSPVNCCLPPDIMIEDGDVVTITDKYGISAGDTIAQGSVVLAIEDL